MQAAPRQGQFATPWCGDTGPSPALAKPARHCLPWRELTKKRDTRPRVRRPMLQGGRVPQSHVGPRGPVPPRPLPLAGGRQKVCNDGDPSGRFDPWQEGMTMDVTR